MGPPKRRPLLYSSPHRPSCPPIEAGVAVCPRDRALFLQLHLSGLSYTAISLLPHDGRNRKTISQIGRRALGPRRLARTLASRRRCEQAPPTGAAKRRSVELLRRRPSAEGDQRRQSLCACRGPCFQAWCWRHSCAPPESGAASWRAAACRGRTVGALGTGLALWLPLAIRGLSEGY